MSVTEQSIVGIKGTTAIYDAETDEYEVDLQNVYLISTDSRTKVIRIKIKSDEINKRILENISINPNTNGEIIHTTDNKEIDEIDTINEQNMNTNEITSNEIPINKENEDIEDNKEELFSLPKQNMKEWFTNTVRLPQYFELFIAAGYEDLTYFDEDVQDNDLIEIGINKKPHRRKILKEIQKLILNPSNINININTNNIISQQVNDICTIPIENNNDNKENKVVINHAINENEDEKLQEEQMNEQDIHIKESNDEINTEIIINDENNEIESVENVIKEEEIIDMKDEEIHNEIEEINKEEIDNDVLEDEVIEKVNDNIQIDLVQQNEQTEIVNNNELNKEVIQIEPIKELNEVISNEIENNKQIIKENIIIDNIESKQDIIDEKQQYKLDTKTNIENENENNNNNNVEEIVLSEDEEVVDIDMAMNEMIEKSATQKQKSIERMNSSDINEKNINSSDTGSVSTAMSSNEYQFKVDWRISFIPHNIKKEWIKIMPKSSETSQQHFTCGNDIDKCPCLNRLIFILNNYMLFIKYKISSSMKKKKYLNRDYPKSMNEFLNLLMNYNKIRLMNDYYHIKRYHLKTNMNEFIEYVKTKLVSVKCLSLRMNKMVCLQWNRNNEFKQIYSMYMNVKRRHMYFIMDDSNIKQMSAAEMYEINLQQFLDMIHCSFIHKCISNGEKFVNKITESVDNKTEDNQVIEERKYTFGGVFEYYDWRKPNYVKNKYGNLKKECLNNMYCKMDKNDYNMIWYKAKDFILSNEGKYCISKRIKGKINKIGKEITMDIIISLIIYCNYNKMRNQLKNGFYKLKQEDNMNEFKIRHSEIVNWCKCISEGVHCFGEILNNNNKNKYLYYNINCKLIFNKLEIRFNIPTSTTNKYIIAKCFNNNNKKGICLQLNGNKNYFNSFLNISMLSNYPNEQECVVYGGMFNVNDIIMNKINYFKSLNILHLYYKIITGKWYTQNKNQFKKKHQREIVKYINNMINNTNKNDYIQSIFESMNNNLIKNTIWINRNGMEQLLPELRQLFFDKFINYLRQNYNVKTQYSNVIILKINKENINKSSNNNPIYSIEYKHPVKIINTKNISDLILSFRCYKMYDTMINDMVLKGEFIIKSFSNRIESICISGGIWFPQIAFDKWEFCTFTHRQLTHGNSLFSMRELNKVNNELIVKICFQVQEINIAKSNKT